MKNDGRGRLGGRKKGTPNKVTADVRGWLERLLESTRKQFEADLANVAPEYRLRVLSSLMAYVVPKQAQISVEEVAKEEFKQLEILLDKAPDEAIQAIAEKVIEMQKINIKNE